MQEVDDQLREYEIRMAQNEREIQEALSLRRMVFVEEQQMFKNDDLDANDRTAIYLNAWSRNNILVGTVRCYPDPRNNTVWWGGRLAVHPDFRIRGIGVYLIRTAVDTVKAQLAKRFLANVMVENVNLFRKMGWIAIGEPFESYGHPHQLMEVDLNVCHAPSLQYSREESHLTR
jgi:putative N-acetyltransferase (TIGR04045 family)